MKNLLVACALATCSWTGAVIEASSECGPSLFQCRYPSDFSGVYIGGNVGVVTHTAYRSDANGMLTDNSSWTLNDTNFTGGVQVGYDQQFSNRVIGIAMDWNTSGAHNNMNEGAVAAPNNSIQADLEWYYTIRARAGIIVSDALLYVTGGAAAGRFETIWKNGTDTFNNHQTRWGWVGGVGTEFNVCRDWSIGGEVLSMHFADKTQSFTNQANVKRNFAHGDSVWIGRITVNYHMDTFGPYW